MTADKVKQLTRKLEQQGDVSLEEAEWIYSLVEKNIEKIGKERKFASEDVFLGSRRIGDIEKELHKATGPLGGSRVVLAAKEELANFIYASLNPEIIEEALFKIRSKPVFEGSRKALEKVFEEDMDIGGP